MFEKSPLTAHAKQVCPEPRSFGSLVNGIIKRKCADIQKNDLQQLIGMIYKPNADGVIDTELQVLLSDKVDPRISEYIRSNLMSLHQPLRTSKDMPDDELVKLAPSQYDTYESYVDRVRGYLDSFKSDDKKE